MKELKVFKKPTNQDEAYEKWKIATRMLKCLEVAGLISSEKIKQAEEIATWS